MGTRPLAPSRKGSCSTLLLLAALLHLAAFGAIAAPADSEAKVAKRYEQSIKLKPPLLDQTLRKKKSDLVLARLQPVRYWANEDYTRVVIETGLAVTYNHVLEPRQGDRPRQLYVELRDSRLGPETEELVSLGDGLLKQVRTMQTAADMVRVILELDAVADYRIFNLQDPFRVVIDATSKEPHGKPPVAKATGSGVAPLLPPQSGPGIRRIVLDPGHGGRDPGAIGVTGVMEKDIVLQVAKRVAIQLERELGCEIIFTRDRDVFVPLEERTAIANTNGADLFISIHANSAPSPEARGVETYFLDFATSKDAMRVATRENATATIQLNDLQSILMDLTRSTKIDESAKLAEFVQTNVVAGLSRYFPEVYDLGVKRAPFVVLIGAQMPAVLTEISFLSNPQEEKRLLDPGYQEILAVQIVAGISRYVTDFNLANLNLD